MMGLVFDVALLVVVAALLYSFVRGGGPEKVVAGACLLWLALDPAYHWLFGNSHFSQLDAGHFLLDFGLLGAILSISLQANRMWPLVAAALQLVAIMGHMSPLLALDGMRLAYWAVTQLPFYLTVFCLLVGTISYRKRLQQPLPFRDWRRRATIS